MMDLDSAIQHCEEVARQNEEDAILYSNCKKHKKNLYEIGLAENAEKKCCKCAEEHRQLAEWLKELKAHREAWMKVISAIDQHTEIHSDGELYIKNFDVKKIVAEYRPKEGDTK